MKQFLLLPLLLVAVSVFGQKTYEFDHLLEYQYRLHQDSLPETRFILTNASANNYNVVIAEDEDYQYKIDFTDQDGMQFLTRLQKADFITAETVRIPCELVFPFENRYKKRTKDHAYYPPVDTVIEGERLERYEFRHIDEKFLERKKFAKMYFVPAKNTEYHQPVFLHPTAYEEWKKEKTLPGGIFKTRYQLNHKKDTVGIYELEAVHTVNMNFLIEKDCGPTFSKTPSSDP